MEVEIMPAKTSRASEGGFLPASEMSIKKIGLKISPTLLTRYGKGIEGEGSPCVIEVRKL